MSHNLLQCPYCLAHGEKQILCEVTTSGYISIERHHQSHTFVFGTAFQIVCGRCLSSIFVKQGTETFDYSLNILGTIASKLCPKQLF